ncbi:MAG: hypothetical protein Kow0029_22970 [Candidatus Rifleibacteriota bacterium]
MLRKLSLLVIILLVSSVVCWSQQNFGVAPTLPGDAGLITPVNIKPLPIDEVARKKGISDENPARNIIILFGSGFVKETAAFYRKSSRKKPEISHMENSLIVLPTICMEKERKTVDLVGFLTGDGRSAGIVSDCDFELSSACDFLAIDNPSLLERVKYAMTLTNATEKEKKAEIVHSFAGKIIEFASDRNDLDRLFTKKAEKIIGCFSCKRAENENAYDLSQPYLDELVTASLSRLSVEKNGFILLVAIKGIAKARAENRFGDMMYNLRLQEKVLHQINHFVSGRKDTLVLVVEDVDSGYYELGSDLDAGSFAMDAAGIDTILKNVSAGNAAYRDYSSKFRYFAKVDEKKFNELAEKKDYEKLSDLLQKGLTDFYPIKYHLTKEKPGQSGFVLFSRGLGSDILEGLISYEEFIRRLSLISGIKTIN